MIQNTPTTMSNTSPDYQIVNFTMLGVNYIYKGGSGKAQIVSGEEISPIKEEIEAALTRMPLHHVPACEQIRKALTDTGYGSALPVITYAKDQPQDTLPEGAIS
jgi:hypothetical protein